MKLCDFCIYKLASYNYTIYITSNGKRKYVNFVFPEPFISNHHLIIKNTIHGQKTISNGSTFSVKTCNDCTKLVPELENPWIIDKRRIHFNENCKICNIDIPRITYYTLERNTYNDNLTNLPNFMDEYKNDKGIYKIKINTCNLCELYIIYNIINNFTYNRKKIDKLYKILDKITKYKFSENIINLITEYIKPKYIMKDNWIVTRF